MNFTAKDVQTLREKTGVGMMDCKKALTEADGDMEKAILLLREKGLAAAAKKASRIAAEGLVYAFVCNECKVGVVVEVNSETDFVAKNVDFQTFVQNVAVVIAKTAPADIADLMTKKFNDEMTVEEALRDRILVIGENLSIRRFVRYEGPCATYVHGGGRIAVLIKMDAAPEVAETEAFAECGKDVAMQIAALNATYVDKSNVPADALEQEREVLISQIKNDPKMASKPEAIIAKMVEGRLGKFYENNCLMQQAFSREPDITVGQYVERMAKTAGGDIKVVEFTRFEKGEGLQKREDDFANEVASMIK